jgi:hypothetical protein
MNSTASFVPMWFCTVPETQIPPGSARASNRAAGEDELCAIHLRNRLESRPGDADAICSLILAGGAVRRFHDPARPFSTPKTLKFRSTSTGSISRSESSSRTGDRSRVWRGQPEAKNDEPISDPTHRLSNVSRSLEITAVATFSRSDPPRTPKPT